MNLVLILWISTQVIFLNLKKYKTMIDMFGIIPTGVEVVDNTGRTIGTVTTEDLNKWLNFQ